MTKEQKDAAREVLKVMIKNRLKRELTELRKEINEDMGEAVRVTPLHWDDARDILPSAIKEVLEELVKNKHFLG